MKNFLIQKIQNHPYAIIVGICATCISMTWVVALALYSTPKDYDISKLKDENTKLTSQVKDIDTAIEPYKRTIAQLTQQYQDQEVMLRTTRESMQNAANTLSEWKAQNTELRTLVDSYKNDCNLITVINKTNAKKDATDDMIGHYINSSSHSESVKEWVRESNQYQDQILEMTKHISYTK
ncbi:Uncharacterized protein ChrSV_1547 [Chromobacterium vaccinii]|nr:Uncharacterized protein ChrSW_1547 [Chromobacterium vaccinii]QND89005.1 Uncharacterized protein ChrSV_1547 [Chromobacterium vaccinii]